MKKTKVLITLVLVLIVGMMPFSYVDAHDIDLDPEKLISFPWLISNGEGTISIDDSQTGYSLYYQAVEIPNSDYTKMEEIQTNGETTLDALDAELEKLDADCDNLKTIRDEAFEDWETKTENNASEEEIAAAKTAYDTAQANYQAKVTEYNTKVQEYKTKFEEINTSIEQLVPTYIDSNWSKTEDGKFSVDLSQFTGDKAFAIWAKLVTSTGTIYYDESIYTMSGTKAEEIAVESINLDKTSLELTEGSNYTLVATVSPSDATNKLVVWSSDNENIAKVEDGKITAIAEGTAIITATTKDGGHSATCKVTVTKKVTTPEPTPTPDTTQPDSTTPDGKYPQAGSLTYIIVLAILGLTIIGILTYKKIKYLNFK